MKKIYILILLILVSYKINSMELSISKETNIYDLPIEVLYYFFEKVDVTDLSKLALVDRRFNAVKNRLINNWINNYRKKTVEELDKFHYN